MYPTQQTNKLKAFSAIIDNFRMGVFRVAKRRDRVSRKGAYFLVGEEHIAPRTERIDLISVVAIVCTDLVEKSLWYLEELRA